MAATLIAPSEQVQHLVDQAALLSLYAVPHRARSHNSADGFHTEASLQRFESLAVMTDSDSRRRLDRDVEQLLRKVLHDRLPLDEGRFVVRQQIGEVAGELELDGVWNPADGVANGARRFTLGRVRFHFGESWAEGDGAGRVYCAVDGCETVELFAAAGKLSKGAGKLDGLAGTFVLNGRLDETGGFRGAVVCRFPDPSHRVRTRREIEPPLGFPDPARASFLELRVVSGEERSQVTVETVGGKACLTADKLPARAARLVAECRGYRGLQSQVVLGPILGAVEVAIGEAALDGDTHGLTARYRYRVAGIHRECAGTLDLVLDESVAIEMDVAGSATRVTQFAGIGRIGGGTGVFEGAAGVFVENSAISVTPPALSLLHVTQIADAAGRFRTVP